MEISNDQLKKDILLTDRLHEKAASSLNETALSTNFVFLLDQKIWLFNFSHFALEKPSRNK